MNAVLDQPASAVLPAKPALGGPSVLGRLFWFTWKYVVGAVFCQTFLGSFFAAGWAYRLAQRETLKCWWNTARKHGFTPEFGDFLAASAQTSGHFHWPNWFLEPPGSVRRALARPGLISKLRGLIRRLLHSLALNFKVGVQTTCNTWVLTGPGCLLWFFSWYDGWNNSWTKGYEQAAVGPATGFLGVFLFIAAMFYVPMAQLRQAATGEWRSFYQFKRVWELIRKRWLACAGLALLYSLFFLPVTILKTLPAFFPQMNPGLLDTPPDRLLELAKAYYFWSSFLVFGLFVGLRLIAARIYAAAIVECVQTGSFSEEALAEVEWEALHHLDLLKVRPARPWHPIMRAALWAGTRAGRFCAGTALFLIWFSFVGQVYISEFFLKTERGQGWLNQPLVQLPWFNYTPRALEQGRAE